MFPVLEVSPAVIPTGPLTMVLGVWLGLTVLEQVVKRNELPETIYNLGSVMIFAGFIGARLTHVLLHWSSYANNLTEIVWPLTEGFVSWGGFVVGGLAGLFYGRAKQLPFWQTLDSLTPLLLIGLLTASLADFLAGSRLGETTVMPWGIDLFGLRRHAVQVYEMLAVGVAFAVWAVVWRNGRSFLISLATYTALYTWVSAYGETEWLTTEGYRIPQLISWGILLLCLFILARQAQPPEPPVLHPDSPTATSPQSPDNESQPTPTEEMSGASQG